MQGKIKNNRLKRWMLAGLGLLFLSFSSPSHAYTFTEVSVIGPLTGNICPIGPGGDTPPLSAPYQVNMLTYGLAERIIICVKENVLYAVHFYMLPIVSTYMANTIAVCITFAILLWGMLMVTGKSSAPVRDVFILGLKAGGVLMFTANFNGWFPLMLDIMESMLNIVTTYVSYSSLMVCPNAVSPTYMIVWERMDCAIQTLLGGIFPITTGGMAGSRTIFFGISGFLVASLYSGTIGIVIAAFGFWLIINFLWTLARSLYIFICAYIAFAVMVLISPLFIPMILFRVTQAYFEKWLRLTIGFIIQPIFLFAYLAMLLAAFDTVVYSGPRSLYRAITGVHYGVHPSCAPLGEPFTLGRALHCGGAYADGSQGAIGFEMDYTVLKRRMGDVGELDTGVLGDIGEEMAPTSVGDIFSYLGNTVFKVDALTTVVNWPVLALWAYPFCVDDPGTPENECTVEARTTNYFINLVLSFLMAVITAFIFFILLDALPFVGSGITGEPLSTATLGTRGMGPPGEKTIGKIKQKLAARFMGGGG